MSRRAYGVCLVLVAVGLGTILATHTNVTTPIEDVTLVTVDALPDHVIVVEHRPPAVHVTRVRAAPKPSPAAGAVPKPQAEKWTLGYSCADVKYYDTKYSKARLEAMRTAAGVPKPTPDELRQIKACLAS